MTGMAKTPGAVLMYWDYDTQWGADRSRGSANAREWGAREFEGADRLLEIYTRYEMSACFAVVGAAALPGSRPYHDPGQVRRIFQAGHEIASHSFHHDWLPALGSRALHESLRCSKDALEQCIGAPVTAFVPPYNQPFDYLRGASISLSERKEVRKDRTDLLRLCGALRDTGYISCRVAYRSLALRMADFISGRRVERPVRPFVIGGIRCVRLNSPGGFGRLSHEILDQCAERGGVVVVYGHPHSLSRANDQNERLFLPYLDHVQRLRQAERIRVILPRDLETMS